MNPEGGIVRLVVDADKIHWDSFIPGRSLAYHARKKFEVRLNDSGESEIYPIRQKTEGER